jgi:hypothetical protein
MDDRNLPESQSVPKDPILQNSSSVKLNGADSTAYINGITDAIPPSKNTFRLFRCPPYETGFLAKACKKSGLPLPIPVILESVGTIAGLIIYINLFKGAADNPFISKIQILTGLLFLVGGGFCVGGIIGKIISAPFGPAFSVDEIERLNDPVVEKFYATTIAAFKAGILSEYNRGYAQEAGKRIAKFVGQYRPTKEIFNLFFSRFSPKDGEFFVYFSKDAANFILTNQRFIFRDIASNNYVEIDLYDLQSCTVKEAWKITFDFRSGDSRTYKFDYDYNTIKKVLSFCIAAQSK